MNTLYDILGVGIKATPGQIEHGYKERLDLLKERETSSEEDINQMRVLREAYLVLSSPDKRKAYDEKIRRPATVSYEVVDSRPLPWATILIVAAILCAGGLYYHKAQQKKARQAQIELEAAKAKAEAEKAAQLAAQEEAALERERILKLQREEAANRNLTAQARYEGQRVHVELQNFERQKEQQARQAKLEQEREERTAKARSQEETYKMQRALSIPIRRY